MTLKQSHGCCLHIVHTVIRHMCSEVLRQQEAVEIALHKAEVRCAGGGR